MSGISNAWYIFKSLPYAIVGVVLLLIVVIGLIICQFFVPKYKDFAKTIIGRIIVSSSIFILTIFMTINLSKFYSFMRRIEANGELTAKERDILLKEEKLKNEQLKTEIENLKHTSLNVQSFENLSELCLLGTNMKSTIAHTKTVKDPEQGITKIKGEEFWVVSLYDFEGIKYGVDLTELKILQDGNDLYVYGIKPKYIGIENPKLPNDVLCEIRSYELKDGEKVNVKVLNERNAEANKLADKYHTEDTERIKKAIDDYEWIRESCWEIGKVFVEDYLKLLNKNIKCMRPEDENESAIPLQDYLTLQIESKLDAN